MNNYIVGYLEFEVNENVDAKLSQIAVKYGIGIKKISADELFEFSKEYLPDAEKNNFIFSMSDSPDCEEADFLIDYLDYAPEMEMSFPSEGIERLKILIQILLEMINETQAKRLVISLTDSGYIYSSKKIKVSELQETLLSDFEEDAPPDRLYEIISESS